VYLPLVLCRTLIGMRRSKGEQLRELRTVQRQIDNLPLGHDLAQLGCCGFNGSGLRGNVRRLLKLYRASVEIRGQRLVYDQRKRSQTLRHKAGGAHCHFKRPQEGH